MQTSSTPLREPLGRGPSSSSLSIPSMASTSRIGDSSSLSLPRTPGGANGKAAAAGNALLRARKSGAPELGTPIKVASSSPFRTPESTSKAAQFLARTPFGTPAKNKAAAAAASSSAKPLTSTPAQPLKPVTGFGPNAWALIKSLADSNAYTTFALQPRPHLSYSSFLANALQANWIKLGAIALIVHHSLFCAAQFELARPLQSITLPLRPTALFLSLTTFSAMLGLLLVFPGQTFSRTHKQWRVQAQRAGVQDARIAGFTLPAGAPAQLIITTVKQQGYWLGVVLHTAVALMLAFAQSLALMHYDAHSDGAPSWSPYEQVPVRLSQGFKTWATRPNERFWFLIASNAILGGLYALLRAVTSTSSSDGMAAPFAPPRFEAEATIESALARLQRRLRRSLPRTLALGAGAPLVILQLYFFFRRPIFRLILSLIGHQSPLRPILIPSFRRSLLTFDLAFRSSVVGLATVMLLEVLNVGWEVFATQPISLESGGLSRYSREPTKCLINGMRSRRTALPDEMQVGAVERAYYAHFAFAEMATVVATDADRRKAVFRDVGGAGGAGSGGTSGAAIVEPGARSAWAVIASECLTVLQEERKWVENKGRPVAASATGATSKGGPQAGQSHLKAVDAAHEVVVATGNNGVKGRAPSIWDRLASSMPASTKPAGASAAVAAAPAISAAPREEGLGSLLHRIAPPPALKPASKPATTAATKTPPSTPPKVAITDVLAGLIASFAQTIAGVFHLLPSDLQHVVRNSFVARKATGACTYFFTPSNEALLLGGAVPNDEALATWSVQILGALLSASLEQDTYGTVALAGNAKLGLDDVLEECAALLLALQRWSVQQSPQHGGSDAALRHFATHVAPLIAALRTTITLVSGAFEPTGYRMRSSCRSKVDQALAATA